MQRNQCSYVPVADLARPAYTYVHPFIFSNSPHLPFCTPLSPSVTTFVQLLHILPLSYIHLSHFAWSFQIWGNFTYAIVPQRSQRSTAKANVYTTPFKAYCLPCHLYGARNEHLVQLIFGVWKRDAPPLDLQAAPRISSPAEVATTYS